MKKIIQLLCAAYLKVVFVVLIFCCGQSYAAIRYVRTGSAGTAPYTSWATASNDLQAVINACSNGDEIWVAAGTYKPNRRADALTVITATNRNNAFVLMTGVKIYGGFAGTETLLIQRNVTANVVTLSGDIGTAGIDTDNCYHVVISSGNNNATRLDGVQVVLGNANGSAITSVIVNTRTIYANRGGGIYAAASDTRFDECTIRRNNTSGNGAGVYDTLSTTINLTASVVTQNIAGNNGGGIYNAGSSPDISNCNIIQNDAGNNGGGIFNSSSAPDISGCDIMQNEAVTNGGGLYNLSSTPVLSSNNIDENVAGNHGGGIFNSASANNITAGFITDNVAGNNGGGVYNASASGGTISDIKILNNTADFGGAMYNNNSSPLVTGCALYNNTASTHGGAVFCVNSNTVEFDQCAFNFNSAVNDGGALYINGGTAPEIKHCSFRSNSAGMGGGGIFITSSDAVFINCLVAGNAANFCGGVQLGLSDVSFINCTVAANKGVTNFGGISVSIGSSVILRNSIVWGNESPFVDNMGGGGAINATYSNIEGGVAGAGNINSTPLFTDPQPAASAPTATGEYSVLKCSPVINAGSNSLVPGGISQDIDGNIRINYGIVDMGAYEKKLAVKAPSGIVYVDHTKSGNGSNWANASPSLADALLTAKYDATITQIWVAKGTYYPEYNATNLASLVCNTANRYNSFVLVDDVKVYGGFENGDASLADRDIENNVTILSGDINADNTSAGNTYHVVISAGAVGTAILDGFTITGGNADYSGNSVTVNGITVTSFYGGGMGISLSSPAINDCIIQGNYGDHGGGISVLSGAPVFNRCIIRNNVAGVYGGAMDHWVIGPPSNATFNNCLITGNRSNSFGGAFVNTSPSVIRLNNTTVVGNYAVTQGGGLWSNGPATEVFRNSIIWGNRVGATVNNIYVVGAGVVNATYCNIEGGYAGTGNISSNPLFVDEQPASAAPTMLGNYHLQKCSPAINVGSNAAIPAGITKDLDSSSRIHLGIVDMGAYEKHLAKPDANGIVYVDSSNTSVAGDGRSWADAVTELADALKEAKTNSDIKEIWVAKGTYKPVYDAADAFLNSVCHTTDRDASFVLVPDVKLFGGFAGGETSLSQRNIAVNQVSFSGDIGVVNDTADNVCHVVTGSGNATDCIVDGVTVERGNATNYTVLNSIIVNGNNISKMSGGGVYLDACSPLFRNCTIRLNNVSFFGGGIFNTSNAQPIFSNCSIIGNRVNSTGFGAGVYAANFSKPHFYGCRITGNRVVVGDGAGLYFGSGATGTISSCSIAMNNSDVFNSGVFSSSPLDIRNSIVQYYVSSPANISIITNSCLTSSHPGSGNITALTGLFIATGGGAPSVSGDYRLQSCSPALNLGDNSLVPPGLTKDLDSLDRIKYSTVDMGAYEMQTIDLNNTTWKGVNTNWNDKLNWCGGYIPADTTNVTVPLTANNPVIGAGHNNEVKNISLANNTSLGVANTSSFTINGTYTNLGSTITNNGDWLMAGSAASQTFPGTLATVSAMNNLEIDNSSGIKFDKSFVLTGTLTPTAGNINVDNATVTLNSDATSTARVAAVPATVGFSYTGTGKFEIERYIPPHRAWRLLTAPLSTATNLTISEAWQEGVSNANRLSPVDPSPGFGTTITKSTTYNAADGYDQGSTNNPSIRYYNGTNWGGVPSQTNGTTPGANNGLINDKQGYMLFVRGDRSIQVAGTGVTATATTLRPKGQLKTGPQTINCSGWTVVGNPYASPINFHRIVEDNPGLPDVFYVWDANLAGSSNVGGWVTYASYNPGTQTYTVSPLLSGSTFANNKGDIASGSAFMVNYTGSITINENHKSTLGDNVLYRPVRQFSMNLYTINGDSSQSLNDGLVIKMEASARAASAEKNANFTENLAVSFEGKRYAIQNRYAPRFNDTVFIYTGQMKQRNYILEIKAEELDIPNRMKAYLEDTYLHHYQPVALEGVTRYAFEVNADSASVSAQRFRLLFKKQARFAPLHAAAKEASIEVRWSMEENFDIAHYDIEHSANGTEFTLAKNLPAKRQEHLQNQWLDISPATGTNYYRIKAISSSGEVLYSDIAKASIIKNNAGMYVYPNPVTGKTLHLRMNNQPGGQYNAAFIHGNGQLIFMLQWQQSSGTVTRTFELPAVVTAGIYQLEVTNPTGTKEVLAVEVQP